MLRFIQSGIRRLEYLLENCWKIHFSIFHSILLIRILFASWRRGGIRANFPSWMNIDVYGTNTMLILARRGYSSPPRVVRHYNNAIALKEKNCYKIAHDRTGRMRGPTDSEAIAKSVSRARRRPMAAAASAAISMEMRWMSAILYDKISPQKTSG